MATLNLEDMRDHDGDPTEVAIAAASQLHRLTITVDREIAQVERIVRNAVMQEALDVGRPLTGRVSDPYTHYAQGREAELLKRLAVAGGVLRQTASALEGRLATPALERE